LLGTEAPHKDLAACSPRDDSTTTRQALVAAIEQAFFHRPETILSAAAGAVLYVHHNKEMDRKTKLKWTEWVVACAVLAFTARVTIVIWNDAAEAKMGHRKSLDEKVITVLQDEITKMFKESKICIANDTNEAIYLEGRHPIPGVRRLDVVGPKEDSIQIKPQDVKAFSGGPHSWARGRGVRLCDCSGLCDKFKHGDVLYLSQAVSLLFIPKIFYRHSREL
jgi:ribosomal protein L31E